MWRDHSCISTSGSKAWKALLAWLCKSVIFLLSTLAPKNILTGEGAGKGEIGENQHLGAVLTMVYYCISFEDCEHLPGFGNAQLSTWSQT